MRSRSRIKRIDLIILRKVKLRRGLPFPVEIAELSRLREAAMKGEGPVRLAEKREIEDSRKAKEEAEAECIEKEAVTISTYFDKTYFPWVKNNKAENTIRTERLLFDHWINPVIGDIPLIEVVETDVVRVKEAMFAAKKQVEEAEQQQNGKVVNFTK